MARPLGDSLIIVQTHAPKTTWEPAPEQTHYLAGCLCFFDSIFHFMTKYQGRIEYSQGRIQFFCQPLTWIEKSHI